MKHKLVWIFLLCPFFMQAQTVEDSIEIRRALKDPFYIQLFGGINKSANENLPWTEFSSYPWSGGGFLALGREFSPLWGWRVALRLNHNKSRNVQVCESKDIYGWNNLGLFGDVTFDVTDVFRRKTTKKKFHRFNLKAFAGVGIVYTWDFDNVPLSYTHAYSRSSKLLPAVRAGATATYRLSRRWRIGAELSQTVFEDHFNGVAYDTPMDTRTNLKVGVVYLFAKRKPKPRKPVERRNRLGECPPLPLIMPEPEDVKLRQIAGRAFLDFPVNETIIYPEYRHNPNELARINATIDSALFDKSIVITQITLHGYASPESPFSNNTRLAKGRTEALKNYLMERYEIDSDIFKNTFTPEDWENLRGFLMNEHGRRVKGEFWYESKAYVETPEMPAIVTQHRDELVEIIDREMDPDAKEELLKKVANGKPYQWLLQHVYPGLRHTDYTVEYEVKNYSVQECRKLMYTHPEALSLQEIYKAALSFGEKTDGWMDALRIAAQQYPEDETANLNAACASVMMHRLNDAKRYLKQAGDSEQAKYVGNVIRAMQGEVKWKMENGELIILE